MNYLQTGKRNGNIRTGWERMRCAREDIDVETETRKVQHGEVGSKFQRTLKDGSVGMGPRILINKIGKVHL